MFKIKLCSLKNFVSIVPICSEKKLFTFRSHTVSSSTSSSGFLSFEQASSQVMSSNETWSSSHNRAAVPPPQSSAPSYMNIDLGSDASPLSPSHSTCESSTPLKEEIHDALDGNSSSSVRTYMNISPGQEKLEPLPPPVIKSRPPALSIVQQHQQSESEDGPRHCYANLEASEIEGLKKRFSATSIAEKLPLQSQTPPPLASSTVVIREVSYAVLDLDKKDLPAGGAGTSAAAAPSITATTTTTSMTITTVYTTTETSAAGQLPASSTPPDSPVKNQQVGYVTIDFNKTAALSHSVNSNDMDEGSRKTRHNSTISDLIAPPSTRHNSSISE